MHKLKVYEFARGTKGPFIFYEVAGAGGIFWTPITNYHAPPPTQSSFFLKAPPPPHRRSFLGGDPPFKGDVIIIKLDMQILCSVQYDYYFLFNVKLLTTHSTDEAATSVNSKNEFCPFAKALLHYFSNIKKYRESKERKVNCGSSV